MLTDVGPTKYTEQASDFIMRMQSTVTPYHLLAVSCFDTEVER